MGKREKANYMIQSVSHSIDVLEELAKAGGEVGVTELSKRLKLHKNNVFRLLATLELRGYVEQNPETEDYRLGVKALQLGQSYLIQSDLVTRALPILRSLAESIGETVSLAVLRNGYVQYPLTIEAKRPVRVAARVAASFPAKVNAAGRLLTAQLPDNLLSEVLAGSTPQDAAIKNQLGELRSTGQLIDRGAIEADVISIVQVVRGEGNRSIAAVEVLVPQYRSNTDTIMPQIQECVKELSMAMGSHTSSLVAAIEKEILVDEEEGTEITVSGMTAGERVLRQ
ncbi:MAG: IclR family transcriptional regulator [Bdellovibrionales bacterium]|nr:IclR family transcriptional regulator [Bdellovibrionales bacterium]